MKHFMRSSNRCFPVVLCLCAICGLAAIAVRAATAVFDFEQDAEIRGTVKAEGLTLEKRTEAAGMRHAAMRVGFASSTEKILPRDMPYEPQCEGEVSLSLARKEEEAIQVLVTPRTGSLKGVTVRPAADLHGPGKAVLAASRIKCGVVGYVNTEQQPAYQVSHIGWWPDPILEECVRKVESRPQRSDTDAAWLKQAEAALAVPDSLVRSMAEYSREADLLYRWRDRIGNLIDNSPVRNVNPWGGRFGARGFAERKR